MSVLHQITEEPTFTIANVGALKCKSSSGAYIVDIVAQDALPDAFKDDSFKQFRVAGEKKITLDVATGNYATGPKDDHLLFSYNELVNLGDIPNAKYLQFIPKGTFFSVLDFDTDKSLKDEDRHKQVNYITDTLLNQFEGRIEYSASHLGIHAYIQDKDLDAMDLQKTLKISRTISKVGKIDLEVFSSTAPIILTGNYVEESAFDFDAVPKKIMESIAEKVESMDTPSTEGKTHTEQFNFDDSEVSQEVLNHFKSLDNQNQLLTGYPEGSDCSNVDLYMATLTQKAGFTQNQAYTFMMGWMTQHRPKSIHPISTTEIINKASRAVARAFKTGIPNTPEPTASTSAQAPTSTPTSTKKSIKDIIMDRARIAAKAREAAGKSKNLIHGVIYDGTLNVIYAKSGSGKTKMAVILTMEIAKKHPEKMIYYFAADLSNDDVAEIAEMIEELGLTNFYLDQDQTGDSFLEMMDEIAGAADIDKVVFVVDTLKKISAVNNKDAMSKTFGRLKKATVRGATGIIIAHTNKDGLTISGTAEVEQDSDNVLTVEAEYQGEDKMKATIRASELRCRSRIQPLTLEISRDGFDYIILDKPVNLAAVEQAEKETHQKGNIVEIAQEIVAEYADREEPLTKTMLQKEIKTAETYTGNKKNDILAHLIDKLDEDLCITFKRKGRAILCVPYEDPEVMEKAKNFGENTSTEKESEGKL